MVNSIFDLPEFKSHKETWEARQYEFNRRASYYDGSIYKSVYMLAAGLPIPLIRPIKSLFLPLARAVHIDTGIIPNKWRLAPSAAAFEVPMKQVFAWSQWAKDGMLFVHNGALYGNTGLRVSDLRDQGRVIIKPISPLSFMLVGASLYDATPRLAISVEQRPGADGKLFEFAEVISATDVRTFRNGVAAGFGGRAAVYANALGFVPLVESQHIANGSAIGDCAFVRAIPLLDSLNELATNLSTVIQDATDPQWAAIGVEDGDLKRGGGNVWYIPPGGDVKVLVPNVDINGAVAFLDRLTNQVEKSMPELGFDEITSKSMIAAPTIELQLLELVLLIQCARPNYDSGLVSALRMAGRAAATLGLNDIAVLDSDALLLDEDRWVLPLSSREQVQMDKTAPLGAVA